MSTERYPHGLDRMMERVCRGASNTFDHAQLVESSKRLDQDLSDHIISFAFAGIDSRTSLTQQEQTKVTTSRLAALGTDPQLKWHINVGFNVGLTKEELDGALVPGIPSIGFPRMLNALILLKEVMAERSHAPESPSG